MHLLSHLHGARHRLLALLAGALGAAALLLAPSLANADTASSLSIVGTSDVSDSGLIQNVVQPAFQAAFPQYAFKYTGSATGTAIQNAETGTGGPSMLIVHAASLETAFVQGGFSMNNQPGNALFTNDFIVAGDTHDPAGVTASTPHNAAAAFGLIAQAGAAGNASFISRGGNTTASGTTVEEHAIWALVAANAATLAPGVSFCTVSAADGGGASPIVGTSPAAGGACPDSGTVTGADAPSWYLINTGANQAANVIATNACTLAGAIANGCYSLTDRGTYDSLTGDSSVNQVPNLAITARDNAATAPGGANLLTNYFHAYIINPSKPNETVNVPAAQAFMSVITSPAVQRQIAQYLTVAASGAADGGSAPFKPDASPSITATGIPATATGGQPVTVTGTVTNLQPGFAQVAGQTVAVDQVVGGVPVPLSGVTGTTTATGAYSISFTPPSSGTYEVATGPITLAEPAAAGYSDVLSPGTSTATTLSLQAASTLDRVTFSAGSISARGTLLPVAPDASATATLLARPQKSTGAFKVVGSQTLTAGQAVYAINGALKGGKYTVEVQYADPGQLTAGTTTTKNVTVPPNSVKVTFGKLTNKNGKVTLKGKVSQGPTTSGATVRLFALDIGKVKVTTTKKKGTKKGKKSVRLIANASKKGGGGAQFKQVAKTKLKQGKTKYTIKHTFARGHRYVLQLKFTHKGQATSTSKFKYLNVH
jgi:tungstate transport system substrate-binding protein